MQYCRCTSSTTVRGCEATRPHTAERGARTSHRDSKQQGGGEGHTISTTSVNTGFIPLTLLILDHNKQQTMT